MTTGEFYLAAGLQVLPVEVKSEKNTLTIRVEGFDRIELRLWRNDLEVVVPEKYMGNDNAHPVPRANY